MVPIHTHTTVPLFNGTINGPPFPPAIKNLGQTKGKVVVSVSGGLEAVLYYINGYMKRGVRKSTWLIGSGFLWCSM